MRFVIIVCFSLFGPGGGVFSAPFATTRPAGANRRVGMGGFLTYGDMADCL